MTSDLYLGTLHALMLVAHKGYLPEEAYDRVEILSSLLIFIIHSPRWHALCISSTGQGTHFSNSHKDSIGAAGTLLLPLSHINHFSDGEG